MVPSLREIYSQKTIQNTYSKWRTQKTQVNEGEKHSSHEDGEDEDDLDEVQSSTDLDQQSDNAKVESTV
jgi:hypothetical protein